MNKKELVTEVAERLGTTKAGAEAAVKVPRTTVYGHLGRLRTRRNA